MLFSFVNLHHQDNKRLRINIVFVRSLATYLKLTQSNSKLFLQFEY